MEYLILGVVMVAVVVGLSTISNRLGVAPPLILMLVGVGVSFLPFVPHIHIGPEIILEIILPPLLYATAIALPTVELRRDFSAVGGLAVILVVLSAVILGFILHWLIPDISLPLGIALGAILSPTDAAATTIIKRLGVPSRVRIILQGESLLNDATSLVLLRTAVAAIAASISFWQVLGTFLWAVAAAVVIGALVGWLGVRLRHFVHEPTAATCISLLLPFVAFIPAEACHASGFVAVVAAGIVGAQLGPKHLDARQRVSEQINWHTVEFLLEGAVFLAMGLELYGLVVDLHNSDGSLLMAAGMAGLAIAITIAVRWVYLAGLLRGTTAKTNRRAARTESFRQMRDGRVAPADPNQLAADPNQPAADPNQPAADQDQDQLTPRQAWRQKRRELLRQQRANLRDRLDQADPATRARFERRLQQLRTRFTHYLADVDYLIHQPLGVKEGFLLTWAGMRGVVTLAAAQTLPADTPHRSLLILIAFFVAAGSLVLQGGTLSWVVKVLGLAGQDAAPEGEWARLEAALDEATADPALWEGLPEKEVPMAKLHARREALLDLRSAGAFSSRSLSLAMTELDAQEIGLQVRQSGGD